MFKPSVSYATFNCFLPLVMHAFCVFSAVVFLKRVEQ